MMDYQTAVRGAFLISPAWRRPRMRWPPAPLSLDDGLLFLQEGKIIALLPWQEGEAFLHPLKGYVDLRVSCCCRGSLMPTFTIRRPR